MKKATINAGILSLTTKPTIKAATLAGTVTRGALGATPVIRCSGAKPKLTNNGYACYSGQEKLHVPGLRAALIEYDKQSGGSGRPQGHVVIKYDDGQEFGTYTSDSDGNETYSFW
jgi:hypothetical protein